MNTKTKTIRRIDSTAGCHMLLLLIIAAAVGFTPQNLRLQFKKRYGLTPAEYRQSR